MKALLEALELVETSAEGDSFNDMIESIEHLDSLPLEGEEATLRDQMCVTLLAIANRP